jgi:nitroreductase
MLAAADLGIGSGHSAVGDQELLRSLLGVPDDRFCVALMPLGYPSDRPLVPINQPDRRPFAEVVHREGW